MVERPNKALITFPKSLLSVAGLAPVTLMETVVVAASGAPMFPTARTLLSAPQVVLNTPFVLVNAVLVARTSLSVVVARDAIVCNQ